MFTRPDKTYNLDPTVVQRVLRNEASPLNRICNLIQDGTKILDVGAGNGILAAVLSETGRNVILDGIEPHPYAFEIAQRQGYRRLYRGHAKDFMAEIDKENYDFVVVADVIEHTDDPVSLLAGLFASVRREARIVLSVPNVAFGAVRLGLLNGRFDYVDSGLLERTHLRFFTVDTIRTIAHVLGANIEAIWFLQRNLLNTEIRLEHCRFSLPCFLQIAKDPLSSTYQFVVVLTKDAVTTEERFFGERIRHPIRSYLCFRLGLNRYLAKARELLTSVTKDHQA